MPSPKFQWAVTGGVADVREILVTGFGLHFAYAGHDMHGLTVGPDGRIYWSIGDKGARDLIEKFGSVEALLERHALGRLDGIGRECVRAKGKRRGQDGAGRRDIDVEEFIGCKKQQYRKKIEKEFHDG